MIVTVGPTITPIGIISNGWLIINNGSATVYVDTDQSNVINAPQSSAIPITAGSSFPWSGRRTGMLYGVEPTGSNPGVTITPEVGVPSTVPSAAQIAAEIALSPLALAIAEEIAANGISLVGAPRLLYSGTVSPPLPPAGQIGGAIGKSTYGTTTFADSANLFDGFLNQGLPAGSITWAYDSHRAYYGPGEYPSAGSDSQDIATIMTLCTRAVISFKITPAQGLTTASFNQLKNAVLYLQSVGCTPTNTDFIIGHEANLDSGKYPTPASFINLFQFFQPAIKAVAAYRVCYVPSLLSPDNMKAYYPGDAFVDAIYADYYCKYFVKQGITLTNHDNVQGIADGHLPSPVPLGLGEFAIADTTITAPEIQSWLKNQIMNVFTARLAAGKANADLLWFDVSQTGPDIINGQTPLTQIHAMQAIYQNLSIKALSGPSSSTITVPAGASVTLPPNSPSAGGGFSTANGISYDVTLRLIAGAGSTLPYSRVQLAWFNIDQGGSDPVDTENWHFPMGLSTSQGTLIQGKGPQRGQYLAVTVQNKDSVACQVSIYLNSTSRVVNRDDWRWDSPHSVNLPAPFNQPPGGASFSVTLGEVANHSIAPAGSVQYLLSAYCGEVACRVLVTGAAAVKTVQVQLTPQPTVDFGLADLASWFLPLTLAADGNELVPVPLLGFPRGPVLLTVTNNDANTVHLSFQFIPIEQD